MSGDWGELWDRYAASASLNPAQAFRRALIARYLKADGNARLLDVGCGQGDLSEAMKAMHPGLEILGLDISITGLAESARKVPDGHFHQADLMQPISLGPNWAHWASLAVCSELLEHVAHPQQVLSNIRPLLAPGARLVVTVPAGPMSAFDHHIGHLRHFTSSSIEAVLREAGLEVEQVWRAGFPFFNLYRLVVILRGRQLVKDAASDAAMPWIARFTMRCFQGLFWMNAIRFGPGWQLVAIARNPGP